MAAAWHYQRTEPFIPQGADSSQYNFSREERSALAILIREALQNALDARSSSNSGTIRVVIRNLAHGEFDAAYLERILCHDFRRRLAVAAGVVLPPPSDPSVNTLTIEDYGTIGLQGCFNDPDADQPGENWNAFWLREGQGAKNRGSLGGAGQGKITFFKQSNARCVIGLTVRESDGKRLMMGRANFLTDYRHDDGERYHRCAYFTTDHTKPVPDADPASLDEFSAAFRLGRTATDAGLSLVIPYAKDLFSEEAVKSVVLEFYAPIVAGRLAVQINNVIIDASTVDSVATAHVTDADARQRASCFTQGYRAFVREVVEDSGSQPVRIAAGWEKETAIKPECLPLETVDSLRQTLEGGGRIHIRLPVAVKRTNAPDESTEFDVFLAIPDNLQRTEESFLRRDLVIGGEQPLASSSLLQRARSLTRIVDSTLSEFLLAAEEPSHLKWNESLLRDKGGYKEYRNTLRAVRQAAPRLLTAILGAQTSRDKRALARFFARPTNEQTGRRSEDGSGSGRRQPPPTPPPPPPPRPKYFRYETQGSKARYLPVASCQLTSSQLPLTAVVEFAYEADRNPFKAYDPFDFDLSDTAAYPVTAQGLSVVARTGNRLTVQVTHPDFLLEVEGFSSELILLSRLTYDDPPPASSRAADSMSGPASSTTIENSEVEPVAAEADHA